MKKDIRKMAYVLAFILVINSFNIVESHNAKAESNASSDIVETNGDANNIQETNVQVTTNDIDDDVLTDTWGPSINNISVVPDNNSSQASRPLNEISEILFNQICIVKEPFIIEVEAKDVAPENVSASGLKDIKLYSGDKEIEVSKKDKTTSDGGYEKYTFKIAEKISAAPLKVKAFDRKGNSTEKKASEIRPDIHPDMKDYYFMENVAPTITPNYTNSVVNKEKHWFGSKEDGNFIVTIEDNDSGIKEIVIKDNDKDYPLDDSIKTYQNQYEKKCDVKIDTSKLSNGEHIFDIKVKDNCGNENNKTFAIYVDHETPNISFNVKNPIPKKLDEDDWFGIEDDLKITATINSSEAPIDSVELKINGETYPYSKINDNNTIEMDIPIKDFVSANENILKVEGTVKSESGKSNNSGDSYSCHIDKENPVIKSILVKREDNQFSYPTVINTGIFSNCPVRFTVEAVDVEGDSGIDRVELVYKQNGDEQEQELEKKGNQYECVLPFVSTADFFESNFTIRAYDRFGNESQCMPPVKNSKGDATDNCYIMYENNPPSVNIELAKGDRKTRDDGEIWYNTSKEISIRVEDKDSGIKQVQVYANDELIIEEDKNASEVQNTYVWLRQLSTDLVMNKVEKSKAGKPKDGKYRIKVKVLDNAANSFTSNEKAFCYDETAPVVDEFKFSKKSADGSSSTKSFVSDAKKYGYYFNNSFSMNVCVSDKKASSGLDKIEYKLVPYNSSKKETESKFSPIKNDVAQIDIPKGFKGAVYAKAIDGVGNVSKEVTTLGYIEDEEAPDIKISSLKKTKYKDKSGNKLYSKDVSVNVTIRDLKSGIKTIKYALNTDNSKNEEVELSNDDGEYKEGYILDSGWKITKMDKNLVVEVKREFVFSDDGNNIIASFKASDRANNATNYEKTEKFSIDKTAPIVNIKFAKGVKSNPKYYNSKQKAVMSITVDERNFDEKLFNVVINDTYKNNAISPKFVKQNDSYSYVANIDFPEGDYSVQVSGKDIVGHMATILSNGKEIKNNLFETDFIVDTTNPSVSTNFDSFQNDKSNKNGNFFNKEKKATITVKEHNFDPELMNLKIWEKESGTDQNLNGAKEADYVVYSKNGWESNEDEHSIELKFEEDGIYKVEIEPTDISENKGEKDSTVIFEIDTTAPEILMRNGESVEKADDNEHIEVYDEKRKDESAPTIEYSDSNFDCIKYELVKFVPTCSEGKELATIQPEISKKKITSNIFKLDSFDKDGIYAVKIVAYDKAGNSSKESNSTYVRMVDADVLAYIEDSHPGNGDNTGTGWFSIEDEDGPLSKRPDNFQDLKIAVLSKNDANNSITLNSNDGDVVDTGVECSSKNEVYGAGVYRYVLSKDYFKDHFQEDTDATFYLTVNSSNDRIELGQIHIDNVAPECDLPEYFHNWGWMKGSGQKNIEITNISEKIDVNATKVYIDDEIVKFTYDSDKNKLSFPIENGSHSVGISLVDKADNKYNIPEITHLGVGNFRLYLGIGITVTVVVAIASIIMFIRKRKIKVLQ